MALKNIYIALAVLFAYGGTAMAQDYFDDIYYNPKKDTPKQQTTRQTGSTVNYGTTSTSNYNSGSNSSGNTSTYIANMADMDVDAYNRRGETYYVSSIDTIGSYVGNEEDYVYTQQIQKYYNPTIVVDNANVLGDVLSNAYGNVDIIINSNGLPVFGPYYGWNWPYYSYGYSPWSWGINISPWGWSVGWNWPYYSWAWNWGPGWGPSWGWNPPPPRPGWGPSRPGWGPPGPGGPGWRPGGYPMATWSPNGNRPAAPRPGWSTGTRPGVTPPLARPNGNYAGNQGNTAQRPGVGASGNRPTGVVNNNGKWEYNNANNGHRAPGTGVLTGQKNQPNNNALQPSGAGRPGVSSGTVSRPSVGTTGTTTNGHRTGGITTGTTRPSTGSSSVSSGNRTNSGTTNKSVTTNRTPTTRPSIGTSGGATRSSGGGVSRGTSGGSSRGGGGGGRHR